MSRAARGALGIVLFASVAVVAWLSRPGPPLPAGVSGAIVFVSDRDGAESLYWRRLPKDRERRLTHTSEPVRDPRVSPDGTQVAFAMGDASEA